MQARKALRALKGLVRLQAIIRGRLVRKQTVTTLKCLQSVVNIQSRVCAGRFQSVKETWDCDGSKQLQDSNKKEINVSEKKKNLLSLSQTGYIIMKIIYVYDYSHDLLVLENYICTKIFRSSI